MRFLQLPLAALMLLAMATAAGAQAASPEPDSTPNPWQLLGQVRSHLTDDSPLAVDFTQTFTPAGFSSGDTETGLLSLNLPACARWDYSEPFPRSYLLCDDIAHSWNPGETSGRRFEILANEREGLDLLRLNVDDLQRQYEALAESTPNGLEIRLKPVEAEAMIAEANLTLTPDQSRLLSLSFIDSEGNQTIFELDDYRPTAGPDLFVPPADVEWLEH